MPLAVSSLDVASFTAMQVAIAAFLFPSCDTIARPGFCVRTKQSIQRRLRLNPGLIV